MKAFKKLIIGLVASAVMMSPAASVLADETTTTDSSQTQESTEESTTETIDISNLSFDTMYGNQLVDFLNHQYEYNGEKIPLTESNFYFIQTFLQLSQYVAYGYYPGTTAGYLDLAQSYGDDDEKKTYGDYFVEQAEDYLHSTYIFVERAKAAGLKLTDEDKKAIDEEINEMIEQQAKPAGVSLDVILQLYLGPQCNEQAYRAILENATLAGKYQEKYISDFKIPEEQLMVPNIRYALFYAPGASATDEEKKKIADYLINPVESREASADKPETLEDVYDIPTTVATVDGFCDMSEDDVKALRNSLGLAMTFKDFLHIQNYFRSDENRDPSVTEIRVLDTYWSDHCRHTTFATELTNVSFEEGYYKKPIEDSYNSYLADKEELYKGREDKFTCLMDIALMAMKKLRAEGKLDRKSVV